MEHPTIRRFVETLRKVQKDRDAFYESLVAKRPAPEKLKKYREADGRLLELLRSFNPASLLEFLRSIAYNYQMKN